MNATATVALTGNTLVNESAISCEIIDSEIRNSIATVGVNRTLQAYATSAARGSDGLFRCTLAIGTVQGVFSLSARINTKGQSVFPNDAETVKNILTTVSADSRNSQRKQVSKALNYGWRVTAAGHDVFSFPSIVAMELALKPAKEITTQLEEAEISASGEAEAAEAAAAKEIERAAAAAEAAAAEAAAEAAAAEAAAAEAAAEAATLRADILVALHGTAAQRKLLAIKYPMVKEGTNV